MEYGYPDLQISNAIQENGKIRIEIKKIGSYPIPIHLKLKFDYSSEKEIYKSANVWSNNTSEIQIDEQTEKNVVLISLDNKYIPDINMNNNIFYLNT